MKRLSPIVLVCLLLAGCRTTPTTSVRIDPALIPLIPSDTVLLAGARFDKLKSSPAFQRIIQAHPLPSTGEFEKTLGIDPLKDIWELLIASNGKDAIVSARGRFSEGGLEPKLKDQGAKRFSYKGLTFFGDDQRAIVFINSSTAAAGPTALLKSVVDARGQSNRIPSAFTAPMNSLQPTDQIWMAGAPPNLTGQPGNLGNMQAFVENIRQISAGAALSDGLKAHAEAICTTPKAAEQIHTAIRAMLGLARLNTPGDKQALLDLYTTVQTNLQGDRVKVDAVVPPDLVDALASLGAGKPRQRGN